MLQARYVVVIAALCCSVPVLAVADGTPLTVVTRRSVFGSSIGVGNTLMEHDGRVNFAVRVEGSQATIPLSDVPADATVVQAFLFWGGTFDPNVGINLDRTVDLILPNGTLLNDLSVDTLRPGEPPAATTNRCVQRNHQVGGETVPMFSCRREVTALLQNLGAGGSVGTYELSDVNLSPGDCNAEPGTCEAKFGGWSVVVLWESPTEPVKRDLVLADGFFALDEQGNNGGGFFSSGISPEFSIDGLTVGGDESGELTFMAWEGDAQLGVPPQNLAGNPFRCNDGRCDDFVDVHSNTSATRIRLRDATSRAGNVMNGSNNKSGGSHPGLDIDTFDIGRTGLAVIRTGDTRILLRAGSGDGVADDGSGGSGELFLLGFTLVSVETFAPRFLNGGTRKDVLEPIAGPGETLNYILRIENDGSANATNTIVKDQLPASLAYVPGTTTNNCGVSSADVGGTSPVLAAAGLNLGLLTIGERCDITFKVTIRDTVNEGDIVRNFFTVQADGSLPLSVGPAVTVIENAEIAQPTKSVSVVGGGEPAPGSTLLYRFRVDNDGSRPAPDVSISDDLPATLEAVTLVSAPAGAQTVIAGNSVDVTNIDIAAGSFAEVVISARIVVGTPTGTAIVNQADVDQPSLAAPLLTDDPSVNNTPTDPTTVRVTAGIDLASSTKTVIDLNGGRLIPGDVIEFRVRVDKRGPAATVVTVEDDLPANVGGCAVQAPVPPGASLTCQAGGANGTGRVSGLIGFSGAGVATFIFRVTVSATAPDGTTIANSAVITPLADTNLAVTRSSPPLVVFARSDLQVSKAVVDVNGGQVRPDDVLAYTMTLTNPGTVAANNVVITDAVDANLVVTNVLDGGVATGQNIRWTVASIAVGATVSIRFEARVRVGVLDGTSIANRAQGDADDPQALVNSNTVTVVVRASPILTVQKTVVDRGAAPFRPADVVGYTITVRNSGDGVARDVVVRDLLDTNFETPILTSGGRIVGGAVVFDDTTVAALDSIAIGATVTLTFDARLDPVIRNGTVVANQAETTTPSLPAVTVLSDDPATGAALDPTRFTIVSQGVIAMAKTFVDDNSGALLPGETVTFTLAVTASGDAPAEAVLVEDPLDARLTFVSSVDGGALVGGRVRFPTFTLSPGAGPRLLRFVARVTTPLADGTTIDNQATASSTTAASVVSDDPNTAVALDPTRLLITSRPIFDTSTKAVVDVAGDGVFSPRDRVRYTIVVENTGSQSGNAVRVVDVLPAQLTNIAAPGPGGSVAGQTVTFVIGNLPVGARRTLLIEADIVRPLADNTVVSNQAVISDAGQPDVVTDDPATVVPDDPTRFTVTSDPRLVVQKTVVDANAAPAEPGDTLTWTITLQNAGDRDADAVTVTDVVDANLVGVVALDGGTLAGNTITWTLARIAVDATATVRFTSVIRAPLNNGTVINNQARAAPAEAGIPGAPFLSDDPATAVPLDPTRVQVVSAADLSVSTLETFNLAGTVTAIAAPGETIEYRLVVANRGRAIGQNVVVAVPFPAGFVIVDAAGGTVAGTTVTLRVGDVAPGATVERRLRVRLATPLDDATVFNVQASLNGTGFASPFLTDDPSTATLSDPTRLEVDSAPIFVLQKTFVDDDAATDGGIIEPGDNVTYTLSLQNTGNAIARDVVVEDPFPAQTLHVSGGRLVGGSVFFDRVNEPRLATVAPGAPAILVRFTVRVNPATASGVVVSNQGRVSGSGVVNTPSDDPLTAVALDPTRFTTTAIPRLTISKTVTSVGRVFAPGDTVAYSLTLTSAGSAPASGAFVDVVNPSFVTVTPGAGLAFNAATRTLTANIAPLAPGATRTLTFTAVVAAAITNGTIVPNQASVTGAGIGTVLSDDPTTVAVNDPTLITIDASPNLQTSTKVAVDEDGGALLPGDRVRYTISVINTGTGTATDVRITDAVDAALVSIVAVDQGTSAGNVVVFDATTNPALAAIGRGARVDLTFSVEVLTSVIDGTTIDNQASIVSRDLSGSVLTDDPATAAVDDPTRINVRAPVLQVEKSVADVVFVPGAPVRYVITIENQGSVAATGVTLRDVLPTALTAAVFGNGSITGGVATASLGTIAPGATTTIEISGVIDPFAVGDSFVSNQAEVSAAEVGLAVLSDDPSTGTPLDPTTRAIDADETYAGTLELFDGDNGAPIIGFVRTGQRIRAKVTVNNVGTQTGRAVVVEVPFERLQFVADETTEGGLIDGDGDVRWTASQLPALTAFGPGASVVVELEGRINSPLADGTEIPVQADVTSISSTTPTIIGPVIMRVRSRPDLSASTKEVIDLDGGLVEPGDVLRWRITVINDGGTEGKNVVVADAIPAGMVYLQNSTTIAGAPVADTDGVPVAALALGDVSSGRSVVVEFQTRVNLNAPRGVVLSNQAVLRADGVGDARTDDPRTPLVIGDATSVVVGGGPLLVASKIASPSTAQPGVPVTFAIHIENAGTEAANDIVVDDVLPADVDFVRGSLVVDGVPRTDAADGDDAEIDVATVRLRRARLEAGDGVALEFQVTARAGVEVIINQGRVSSSDGTVLTDGDLGVPGLQPTIVPVVGALGLLFDENTLQLEDVDGGVLLPGDRVLLRASLRNRGLVDAFAVSMVFPLPPGLRPAPDLDARFTLVFDEVRLDNQSLLVEADEGRDFALAFIVDDDAPVGQGITATGTAEVRAGTLATTLDLGSDALTVGLLAGTASLTGSLFVEDGERDGAIGDGDVRARGFTVQAFWRDDEDPVLSVITDEQGTFRLTPIPSGRTRLVVLGPSGARYQEIDIGPLADGEVREQNVALEPSGSVWVTGTGRPARGTRLVLFVDDGDDDLDNDARVDAALLGKGQQEQPVSSQGFFRFDAPPGSYRLGVVTEDPLLTFPSSTIPVQRDQQRHPLGRQALAGDVSEVALPDDGKPPPWIGRFRVGDDRRGLTRNHLPLDPLAKQIAVSKTASRKRASIGEIVTYEVRVENKALQQFDVAGTGGVEIVDTLPAGFKLIDGSFQLARLEVDGRGQQKRTIVDDVKAKGGRTVRFGPFGLLPKSTYQLRYNVVVGPGTPPGEHTNTAALRLAEGSVAVSDVASAAVQVVADDTFDLGVVRGKVFCDGDSDGWQDPGERGVWGARVYLDNGTYGDADPTGKLHFTGVQPGMHVAKLDERTMPGTIVLAPRQTFYMSGGLPAQIAFPVHCHADVVVAAAEFEINEAAYRPIEAPARKLLLEGGVSPTRVVVDGQVLLIPQVAMDLAARGKEPVLPGPNLESDSSPLELRPRVQSPAPIAAWQIVIDDVTVSKAPVATPTTTPTTLAPEPKAAAAGPTEIGAAGFERSLAAAGTNPPPETLLPAPAPAADSPAATTTTTPVYVFAGKGLPPDRIVWAGRDERGNPVTTVGHTYRAILTVGVEGGDRVSTAPMFFGVAVGAEGNEQEMRVVGAIDESEGALFLKSGKPSKRLLGFVGTRAAEAKKLAGDAMLEVRVHLDNDPGAPAAQVTAQRADVVVKALVDAGAPAARIKAVGKGDEEPLFPNGREKDRKKNRRVELVVPASRRAVPPLPAQIVTTSPAVVRIGETLVPVGADGAWKTEIQGAAAVVVDIAPGDGSHVRLARDAKTPQPPTEGERNALAPVPVIVQPGARSLVVDGVAVPGLALLDVRVEPRLKDNTVLITVPAAVEVRKTTVRVFREHPNAPAFSDDDAVIGTKLADIVVEGRADRVTFETVLPAGSPLRFRAIIEDDQGNTGISPDVRVGAGENLPGSDKPVAASSAPSSSSTLADPGDASGVAPSAAASSSTSTLAKTIAPGSHVRIEVHTDDRGPRMERLARTQQLAEALRALVVAAGVPEDHVTALGKGSDSPLVPNSGARNKAKNRRAEIVIEAPAPIAAIEPATTTTTPEAPAVQVKVNGSAMVASAEGFNGSIAPLDNGELAFEIHDVTHARASVRVRKATTDLWQGSPEAFRAAFVPPAPPTVTTPETTPTTTTDVAAVPPAELIPHKDGAAPAWWPTRARVPASGLSVSIATGADGALTSDLVPVRGTASPESRVHINGLDAKVDPLTGAFSMLVKLPPGSSVIVVEAVDALGNKARVKRDVVVDNSGWFALLLADTAVGGEGALLDERNGATSLTLGPAFVYGRGVAYVKGNFHGPYLFSDYDLTLHLDTRRWDDDVFFRDVLDPDRGFPAFGDSSFEVQDARSGIPLYLELAADHSRFSVGSIKTEMSSGELFRYQRSRTGTQLRFDRGWLDPVEVAQRKPGEKLDPSTDPWRTQGTTFLAGGGGERHARIELMGTGGSVYFLRHERLIEGSERVAIIVRDGVTGTEIGRTAKARNVDYTIRYNEGRILMKEPVSAFADAAFITNHNLGQVASGHRVFIEVEYEHQDDNAFQGLASGVDVKQTLWGHAEVGASYVVEGREGGEIGYQLGGVHTKLFLDEGTFLQATLLGSQSVDAGNFVSLDGGLTYSSLGQSLDQKEVRIGNEIFPRERAGLGFKLDGQARFGRYVGRNVDDGVARAYFQALQPGFFGGGASIIEQGQTKWGSDVGWKLTDVDELRFRYDGVVSEIPERQPVTEYRVLHRELATGRYARRLLPGFTAAAELGYGFLGDSGSFSDRRDEAAVPRDVHTVITAAGLEWQVLEALQLGLKQEVVVLGDPNQLNEWNDHFITHLTGRYAITEGLSVDGGVSVRWSGENQVHAGIGYAVNETSRIYASERFGVLAAPGTGTMGFSTTTVLGAESELAKGSKAYGEYQLQSAFGAEQTRGVVGLANLWHLPFGFALSLNYERVTTLGGTVPVTENGNVPPAAFTDGTFYAAPGANGGGSFLYGQGTRDAASAGVEWRRDDLFMASERFELRYDNFAEDRGGNDTLWMLSMTAVALKLSPELSFLSRYNMGLAQDLATGARSAYLEEGSVGVAFRPITHDWFSALAKLSRRVDVRPLSLEGGSVDDTTIHAFSIEPVLELPWKVQLVEKLAIKHMSVALDDVPKADALTLLWINRVNWHALGTLRSLGLDPIVPGEIDLGVEYRVLAGLSYDALEHGTLLEVQYAPIDHFRFGVGFNFTRFSDNELDRDDLDRSGFFVRAVGSY
ncbi:MAG: hypothetical protein Q8O67_29365 [Deltaproteobacteria bacterium]|nr:hypothetical protein [Deltaproteobacteria bacterium]